MTILAASQQAIMQLVGRKPAAVVSSTDEICVEITAIAQEAATEIAKAHYWQELTEFYTITANGADTAYPFPADYDRMVQATELYDPDNWCWGYDHISDYGQWVQYESGRLALLNPGIWTIRKNQFHFLPKPASGQKAIFPYITKNIFVDANGARKSEITNDNDSFVLDERVLKLAIIWKWLSLKRMDYQQEHADFQYALSQEAARDKGARVIRKRSRSIDLDTRIAWPWPLG